MSAICDPLASREPAVAAHFLHVYGVAKPEQLLTVQFGLRPENFDSQRPPPQLGLQQLPADRREGGATLRDFPRDALRAQALGGVLGLLEHVLGAVEVLGPAAGDQRAGPAGAGAGEEQRRAEALLDLGGGGEVALGLLVALQGRGERAERPGDRPVDDLAPVTASWPEKGAKSS